MATRKGKRTILGGYTKYFLKEHDIVLDKLSRLFELAGVMKDNGRPDLRKISKKTGVKLPTLARWDLRHVKRPQHAGVMAVVRGLGGSYDMSFGGELIANPKVTYRADIIARQEQKRRDMLARRAMKRVGRGKQKKAA